MKIADTIKKSSAFSHFSDAQVEQLCRCTSMARYPAGSIVIKEGDPTRDAYLLGKGAVRVQRETPFGTYVFADLAPGAFFGEASYIDEGHRSSDILVVEDSVLLPFNALALSTLTERDPHFTIALYWAFWRSLSEKLRGTNEQLTKFAMEGGRPLEQSASAARDDGFRVGLNDRQELFREQKLSPRDITFLSTLSKERRLAVDQVLFREGDPGDNLYIVLEGKVRISKFLPGAGEEALAILDRGNYFGEMALIDNAPRSADARAHQEGAVVLAIPRRVLEGVLDARKATSLQLLQILCGLVVKRLRELNDKLVSWFIFAGGSGTSLEPPQI